VFVDTPNPWVDDTVDVTVTHVRDGDTFEFEFEGEELAVRLLDLETYENRRGSSLTKQAEETGIDTARALLRGKSGEAIANQILLGKKVRIFRDTTGSEENFDSFGRLLRHCELDGVDYKALLPDTVKVPIK
jgi:endonuclease YncB( thermonuclease family)